MRTHHGLYYDSRIKLRGTVGYHVRNLRRKLYSADPHHPFIIESIREIGYRFQTTS